MQVTVILIVLAVLAVFAVGVWLIRRFTNTRLGTHTNRGRMPRLAVIDAAAVDGRRRLVLVRRDNVEHLLMIGGPSDIVVEPNIIRASARGDQLPQRPPGLETPPRIAPLPDAAGWNDAESGRVDGLDRYPEPPQMPEPPPRPVRPSFAEEVRRPPAPERRSDPLAGFTTEPLGSRAEPREPRPEPRTEPRTEPASPRLPRTEPLMPRSSRLTDSAKAPPLRTERTATPAAPPPLPPAPPSPPATADQNLAEMAQRLEAALRRPAGGPEAPPVAPEPSSPPPSRASRTEEPPAPAASPKTGFENLEDEMASLLGRPKSSSSS